MYLQRHKNKKGYSLLEMVVALGVFAAIAGLISVAVTSISSTISSSRTGPLVSQRVSSYMDQISSLSFAQLTAATFPSPDSCTTIGNATCFKIAAKGYVIKWSAIPQTVTGTLSVSSYVDITGTVCSQTDTNCLTNNVGAATASRRITTPNVTSSTSGEGYIRAHITAQNGYTLVANTNIYLIGVPNKTGAPIALAAGKITSISGQSAIALIKANINDCINTFCTIGLAPGADFSQTANISVDPLAYGLAGLVIQANHTVDTQVNIGLSANNPIYLQARDISVSTMNNPVVGSVCIWARFNSLFTGQLITTPLCNTTASKGSEAVVASNYVIPGARSATNPLGVGLDGSSITAPIFPGTILHLYVDNPNGTCPYITTNNTPLVGNVSTNGMVGPYLPKQIGSLPDITFGSSYTYGLTPNSTAALPNQDSNSGQAIPGGLVAWKKAAVCTSWTWGIPSLFGPAGTRDSGSTFQNDGTNTLTADSVGSAYNLVWSAGTATPAVGLGTNGDTLWGKPRQAAGCAFDGTCTGFVGKSSSYVSPDTGCPATAPNCNSVADYLPVLTAPAPSKTDYRVNSYLYANANGSPNSLTMTFKDYDDGIGASFNLKVLSVPSCSPSCTLTQGRGANFKVGDSISTTPGSLEGVSTGSMRSAVLNFATSVGGLYTFTVSTTDGHGITTGPYTIALYNTVGLWTRTNTTGAENLTESSTPTSWSPNSTFVGTDGNIFASSSGKLTLTSNDSTLPIITSSANIGGNTAGKLTTGSVTIDTSKTTPGYHYNAFSIASSDANDIGGTGFFSNISTNIVAAPSDTPTYNVVGNAQGGSGLISGITWKDISSPVGPYVGILNFTILGPDGNATSLVVPKIPACYTFSNGTCNDIPIIINRYAPVGQYSLKVSGTGVKVPTTLASFNVSAAVDHAATQGNFTVDQGSTSSSTNGQADTNIITLFDSNNTPVNNAAVSMRVVDTSSAPDPTAPTDLQVNVTACATTNASGACPLTLTASASARTASNAGYKRYLELSNGGIKIYFPILVNAVPDSLAAGAVASIGQGKGGAVFTTVLDKAGDQMPGVTVNFTSNSADLAIDTSSISGTDGRATSAVSVSTLSSAGSRSITATCKEYKKADTTMGTCSTLTAALGLSIIQTATSAYTSYTSPGLTHAPDSQGRTSSTLSSNLTIYVLDAAGNPMTSKGPYSIKNGTPFTLTPQTGSLDGSGSAILAASGPYSISAGIYTFTLTTGKQTIPVSLLVQ